MDLSNLVKAALFGLVEGATEWLPVSSAAHLLLVRSFASMHVSHAFWGLFLAVIRLAAALAALMVVVRWLGPRATGGGRHRRRTRTLWAGTVVATVPVVIVSRLLGMWRSFDLGQPLVMAASLIVLGIAIIMIETTRDRERGTGDDRGGRRRVAHARRGPARLGVVARAIGQGEGGRRVADLDLRSFALVGVALVAALVPGVSHSAAVIVCCLLLGCTRVAAVDVSLIVALPALIGANVLRAATYVLDGGGLTLEWAIMLIVGAAASYVVATRAVAFLRRLVRDHDLMAFGWYRVVFGIVLAMCAVALW